MPAPTFSKLKSFFSSIGLHIAIGLLLVISFEFAPQPKQAPPKKVNIINAVSVDQKLVEAELNKLKQAEAEKKKAEEKRKQKLEEEARQAEEKRKQEEKKLKQIEQKKIEQEKKRKAEEKRLKLAEQKKKEAEQKRKAEEEKRKQEEEKKLQAEAERKKLEEEKRKKEEELKRIEEEKKRLEEEKKLQAEAERKKLEEEKRRKHEEELMLQELEEEQLLLDEAQNRKDMGIINQYRLRIQRVIESKFNKTGLDTGLSCVLLIRMIPGGDVVSVTIAESSGSSKFDAAAEKAVQKASPLPVPDEMRIFEKMREIRFTFKPEN